MAIATRKAFTQGYRDADSGMDKEKLDSLNIQVEDAKNQFESALSSELGSRKAASAGEFIDGLADIYVKTAEGELSTGLGYYLALAALLGEGASQVGYNWMSARDPRRQRMKELEQAILARSKRNPSPILMKDPMDNLPVPGEVKADPREIHI